MSVTFFVAKKLWILDHFHPKTGHFARYIAAMVMWQDCCESGQKSLPPSPPKGRSKPHTCQLTSAASLMKDQLSIDCNEGLLE